MNERANSFVNPYTFVPLTSVRRAQPGGHLGDGERYSGSITVQFVQRTPLALPVDGTCQLPGSGVHGAVRSLHEAMFNGCYRVIDEAFIPAYRMPARDGAEDGFRLAVVTEIGDEPTVRLCDPDPVWVHARELGRHYPQGQHPTTGDVLALTVLDERRQLGRREAARIVADHIRRRREDQGTIGQPGDHVILVTDTSARPGRYRSERDGCFWAVGRVGDETAIVGPEAYEHFRRAVAHSRDKTEAERGGDREHHGSPIFAEVTWPRPGQRATQQSSGPVVGHRVKATGVLHRGDVVWVKLGAGETVTEIRLAQIWRRGARGLPVGKRLGSTESETPRPCSATGGDGLCLSCQIFGAADTTATSGGTGRQDSYAGHVRFSSLTTAVTPHVGEVHLAPLGAPRPGFGNFYLRFPDRIDGSRRVGDVAGHWGSEADPGWGVRGRKFYWHSDPHAQQKAWGTGRPRYEKSDDQGDDVSSTRRLSMTPGHVWNATVTFDQLDEVQVHSLLAALEPALLLGEDRDAGRITFATHLGGGKPLGLGTMVPSVLWEDSWIRPLHDRYAGRATPGHDWTARLDLLEVRDRVGSIPRRQLRRILALEGLGGDAAIVAYPPAAPWTEVDTAEFRQSFVFAQNVNGERLRHGSRDWVVLPDPLTNQKLPIYRRGRR